MAEPVSTTSIYGSMASFFTPSSLFIFVNFVIATIVITSRFTPKKPAHHEEFRSDNPHLLRRSSSLLDRFKSFNLGFHKFAHEPAIAAIEHGEPVHDSPQPVRTPSMLERVRSFNLGLYKCEHEPVVSETEHIQPEDENLSSKVDDPPQEPLARTPSFLERLKSINFPQLYRSNSIKGTERESEFDAPDSNPGHDSGHVHENLVKRSKLELHGVSPAIRSEKMTKSASEKSGFGKCEEDEELLERRRPTTSKPAFGEDDGVDAKADDFINRFRQ